MYYNEGERKVRPVYRGNMPVDVISVCNADGEIRPLRLQVENMAQERVRIDIERVVSVRYIPYVGVEAYIFLCQVQGGDRKHMVELKYSIRSHCWSMTKRLY